jgi:predicted nucleotidyltransferase
VKPSLPWSDRLQTDAHQVEAAYLEDVAARLAELLPDDLVGVYAGGSWALGDYRPGNSDLDVAVVVRSSVGRGTKEEIAARLAHEALPCPARKLELVVYRLETARSPRPVRDFELNLNTGAGVPLDVAYDAREMVDHWFPIDRSLLCQSGKALRGPAAQEVFAPIPIAALAPALAESIRWHRDHAVPREATLNACRTLLFATEGRWASKATAAAWAVERGLAPEWLVSR